MEYKDLFLDKEMVNPHNEVYFGEDVGLEKIWSVSDEEYLAILKERFPKSK